LTTCAIFSGGVSGAVIEIDAETLEVELPHELHAEQARLELDLYLRVWQSLHEWSSVEYVEKL
jgi:hypothetical protein